MSLSRASDAKTRRRDLLGAEAPSKSNATPGRGDPAKALVMAAVDRFVADGYAKCDTLDNGDIRLRLHTGEMFLLAKAVVIRLA